MPIDLAILGAGPAGVAAAISLRQLSPESRVVLVDGDASNPWRPGEILPPGCRPILDSLHCWERFVQEGFPPAYATSAAWASSTPYDHDFLYSARGSGWRLDRIRFDRMLRDCAQEQDVAILRGVSLPEAAFVIDASGRRASFARRQGARIVQGDRLIGVVGVFPFHAAAPLLVESQPDGWWYSTAIPGSRLVVAWMSDSDLVRRQSMVDPDVWMERLRQSGLTAQRVGQIELEAPLRVFAANSQRVSPTAGPGWAAAGDAAFASDPLSAQGILRALRTGKLAAFAAFDYLQGRTASVRKYDRLIAAEYAAYCASKALYYGLERRWLESEFWMRRHIRGMGHAA